ncbi:hypothetical protein MOBT1_002128 [Malassezia obtusa]|uniref:CREG-like beta-barrel domain-containing protein n=1 Tax=Malassezia obtusa TaxID=76774 RepID=A0AAF0ITQ8_9BASI|nr:hypothetical protein MOBT1_002128 [Malassezia obtusa]
MIWGSWVALLVLCAAARAWETVEKAASDLRQLLVDDTTFYTASLGSVSNDGAMAISAEYYAPCFNASLTAQVDGAREGDLLFLALPVSGVWRGTLAPNASASLLVHANADPNVVDVRHSTTSPAGRQQWAPRRPEWRRGMPSKARTNMHGTMHVVPAGHPATDALQACFTHYHPDAAAWEPGSRLSPHLAKWARFAPERIYYVGGFGDEHYIGDIPVDMYRAETPSLYVQ